MHRSIIGASLSSGISVLNRMVFSEDINATISAVRTLGADIEVKGSTLVINGGKHGSHEKAVIDCRESGSTLRFMIPVSLLFRDEVTFTGRGRLSERPITSYIEAFSSHCVSFSSDRLPVTVRGRLVPGTYEIDGGISSQFVTGLLLALPLLEGDSYIRIQNKLESKGYVDITIEEMRKFGVTVENIDYSVFYIPGNQKYISSHLSMEGDYSQAAFWLAAGALSGPIKCAGLNNSSVQGDSVILKILSEMGAQISLDAEGISISRSPIRGITVDVSDCPDLAPAIAVLGALAKGETRIVNAARLRVKESDRLKAIVTELSKLGAEIWENEDSIIIHGKKALYGGRVSSWNDHRIAMALAVASIGCIQPVIIDGYESINKSYPHFFEDFKLLGGIFDELDLGK